MSRKNTIIIAVLVNVGLLIVLFSTALKTNRSETELASEEKNILPLKSEIPIGKESPKIFPFLNQEKELANALAEQSPPPLSAITEGSTEPAKMDFIADLNAITLPETQERGVPATSPKETKEGSPNLIEVVVKKGDVLEKIARTNNTTVDDIIKRNHLPSSRLTIGQVLKIMPKNEKKETPLLKEKTGGTAVFYTVKNGDNPWTIAVKNHIKVEELLKLNGLNEEKARRLKAGDQLRIR